MNAWLDAPRTVLRDARFVEQEDRPPAALVRQSLRQDLPRGWHHFWANAVAGSTLVPRVLRFALLRCSGLDVRTANMFEHCTFDGTNLRIGRGTFVNQLCYFEAVGTLIVGESCQIGMGAMLLTTTHPFEANGSFSRLPVGAVTTVGNRCWIGAGAIVLPGVTIGDDVVVGAGSVVTKDCEPAGVYIGAPARRVRDLEVVAR